MVNVGSLRILRTLRKDNISSDDLPLLTSHRYEIPPEVIEFILIEVKAQMGIEMLLWDLSCNGWLNDEEVRLQDCYASLRYHLHKALDRWLDRFLDPECNTPTSALIGSLFQDWCDEIIEDYQKEHQHK